MSWVDIAKKWLSRKYIGMILGVVGIVLVKFAGVPQQVVDSLNESLIELGALITSIISISAIVISYIKGESAVDAARASNPPPVEPVAAARSSKKAAA